MYYLLIVCCFGSVSWPIFLIPSNEILSFRIPTAQETDGGFHSGVPTVLSSSGLTLRGGETLVQQQCFLTLLLSTPLGGFRKLRMA